MSDRSPEECIARVVWAAHILSYLTNDRKHEELLDVNIHVKHDVNTDESDECEMDYESDKTVILSGPRESVRQKFLDCIAQLLSPCKGWDGVTATALREEEDKVEVDVARNDGFLSDNQAAVCCRILEEYLAGNSEAETGTDKDARPPTDSELKLIDYTYRRVDYWIGMIQKVRNIDQKLTDKVSQCGPQQESAVEVWTSMRDLVLQYNPADEEAIKCRHLIVQQAYKCLNFLQFRDLLSHAFGPQLGSKLWSMLNFIARPLIDCRLMRTLATREVQFQNCKISLVTPKPRMTLDVKYVVGITEAWNRLGLLGSTPESLSARSRMFKKTCAKSFTLHAEMQLVLHCTDGYAPHPTLNYFGCSRKTCLLCEIFLGALPNPIATRGRHGVCYPAWAVPGSRSSTIQVAIESLEKNLIARIRGVVQGSMHGGQKHTAPNVVQSGMVSSFSQLTLQEWQQRQEEVRLFNEKQTAQRKEMLITEGIIPSTEPRYRPIENFEPEDCCVMCNTRPGRRCKRCWSIYYCSKDCQKSDFSSHKLLCKKFAIQPDRPSLEHKRAILFPVDSDKPRLIWVPCRSQYDKEDGVSWTKIDPFPFLGNDDPVKGEMRIEHNPVRSRNLGAGFAASSTYKEGYCVCLIYREAYLIDGSTTNRSVLASVAASCTSPPTHEYCGPMIALRGIHHEDYADITLADFRHLMDYLISYRNTHIKESVPGQHHRASTTVRGVKICCDGEISIHGSNRFVTVDITRANQVALGEGSISPISCCLGMPLILWKDSGNEFFHNPPGLDDSTTVEDNDNAAFLMMCTDPSRDDWGWAPPSWNGEIGNVWAVREDGIDLSVDVVAMMCHFARHKLQRMFEDEMESELSTTESRQRVLNFITWENMTTHWDKVK